MFRVAEILNPIYRDSMTMAEHFRSSAAHPTTSDVSVAGVPWPTYKLLALAVGLLVLLVVAVITSTAAPAVLGGAAAATVIWLGLGVFHRQP